MDARRGGAGLPAVQSGVRPVHAPAPLPQVRALRLRKLLAAKLHGAATGANTYPDPSPIPSNSPSPSNPNPSPNSSPSPNPSPEQAPLPELGPGSPAKVRHCKLCNPPPAQLMIGM